MFRLTTTQVTARNAGVAVKRSARITRRPPRPHVEGGDEAPQIHRQYQGDCRTQEPLSHYLQRWVAVRAPGEGRYAQLEREQRWTVFEVPAHAERSAAILDRYIFGTRLRLRRAAADDVVFKLTQKVRAAESDPEVVKLTNVYLSAEEYDVVAALPAAELRKSRWHVSWDGRRLAISCARSEWDATDPLW